MKGKWNLMREIKEEKSDKNIPEEPICQSCKDVNSHCTHLLKLRNGGKLELCALCKPWVKGSLYDVPGNVKGIKIKDSELFIDALCEIDNFREPETDDDWFQIFLELYPHSHKDVHKIEQSMKLRFEPCSEEIDLDYSAILSMIEEYRFKISALDSNYQDLEDSGWKSYADNMEWDLPETLVIGPHKILIKPQFMGLFAPITEIDGMKFDSHYGEIANELLAELIFDSINNLSNLKLHTRVKQISDALKVLSSCKIKWIPSVPHSIKKLSDIILGKKGKKLQYKLLAIMYTFNNTPRTSHNFLLRDQDVWARSFQFLRLIIDGLELNAKIESDGIVVTGSSGIVYTIKSARYKSVLQFWQVSVKVNGKNSLICIEIQEQHKSLPIGDQLASLVLALSDDLVIKEHIYTIIPYIGKAETISELQTDNED